MKLFTILTTEARHSLSKLCPILGNPVTVEMKRVSLRNKGYYINPVVCCGLWSNAFLCLLGLHSFFVFKFFHLVFLVIRCILDSHTQ